jgi:hypothetical protein
MNKRLLASSTQKATPTMTNRLDNIATRQSKTRARDVLFAAFVALAAVISISTLSTAAEAAQPSQITSR